MIRRQQKKKTALGNGVCFLPSYYWKPTPETWKPRNTETRNPEPENQKPGTQEPSNLERESNAKAGKNQNNTKARKKLWTLFSFSLLASAYQFLVNSNKNHCPKQWFFFLFSHSCAQGQVRIYEGRKKPFALGKGFFPASVWLHPETTD